MSAAPKKLAELRHLLAERFPTVSRPAARALPTGIPGIDSATSGLPLGAVTEIVCSAPSCGGHLLFQHLLRITRRDRQRVALIDSTDSFDPGSYPGDLLVHLLWVRCTSTTLALQATDLITRDANLGLVLLDLRYAPASDLRRIPGPQWYRLQRAVEPTDLALVIATPRASVPSAQVRFEFSVSHSAAALDHERTLVATALTPSLQRQRLQIATG